MLPPELLQSAISPLRMIFWGGLLCVLDLAYSFTTNGHGFRFDLLNDALGMAMIVWGVSCLRKIPISGGYGSVMRWAHVVAVIAMVEAIAAHVIAPVPPPIQFGLIVLAIAKLTAVIGFCVAMRWFCEAAWFAEVAQSWSVSCWLYVIIYAIPLGLLQLAAVPVIAGGRPMTLDLGPAGLVVLLIGLIPLIHLFVSLWRTIRRLEGLGQPPPKI